MSSPETLLITSATGKIGTALVHLASARPGVRVRVATRSPTSPQAELLRSFRPEQVECVAFDDQDEASLARAFDGVTQLMVIAPFAGDMEAWHQRVVSAAKKSGGVRFLVKVSVTGARSPESDPPPGRIPLQHFLGEEVCRASGIPTLSIRPTIFAQHFLMGSGLYERGDDRFYLPTGAARVAFLDCRDIAACADAAFALDDDDRAPWAGRSFELTGPQAVTAADIATTLGRVAGRPFTHIDGMEAFEKRCAELKKPDFVKGIYGEAAGGWFGEVATDEFASLVGRSPTSFAKFAFDHAAWFSN